MVVEHGHRVLVVEPAAAAARDAEQRVARQGVQGWVDEGLVGEDVHADVEEALELALQLQPDVEGLGRLLVVPVAPPAQHDDPGVRADFVDGPEEVLVPVEDDPFHVALGEAFGHELPDPRHLLQHLPARSLPPRPLPQLAGPLHVGGGQRRREPLQREHASAPLGAPPVLVRDGGEEPLLYFGAFPDVQREPVESLRHRRGAGLRQPVHEHLDARVVRRQRVRAPTASSTTRRARSTISPR
mmetsp:Transcript_39051/g.78779  ORF Transcript_39051/g.78779 Transcript_39051/m.78779 type:complete len:242 (-) Transcript_39051:4-729(-)